MTEETTLKDEIRKLNEVLKEKQEVKETKKKFKLPGASRLNKSKIKKNYAIVIYINDNRSVKFMKQQIDEGTIMVEDKPYLASAEHLLSYQNKPLLIIPSWNTKPFSPDENVEEAIREKTRVAGYQLLLNRMQKEVITAKKKGGIFIWVILGIIALAVGYFLLKGGVNFHF